MLVKIFVIILAAVWKTIYKDRRQDECANKSFVLMFNAKDFFERLRRSYITELMITPKLDRT